MQGLQDPDEGTQGAHLPQETKMEVPEVRQGQDAGAKICLEFRGRWGRSLLFSLQMNS